MSLDFFLSLVALLLTGAMLATLAGVLRWYASPPSQAHYRHWAAAWAAQAAYYLVGGLAFSLAMLHLGSATLRLWLAFATQFANTLAALLLVVGAIGFVNKRPVEGRTIRWAIAVALVLGAVVALSTTTGNARYVRFVCRAVITGGSFVGSGVVIWRAGTSNDRPKRFLSAALIGFGLLQVHYLIYWMLTALGEQPSYRLAWFTVFDIVFMAIVATSMVAMGFADQRDASAHALRQREREFRQMIEHSSDIVTVIDATGALRYASPSARRILGWGDEVLGHRVLAFVHPDDRELAAAHVAMADRSGGAFQLRVRSHDGNWVRLEALATRSADEPDRPLIIVNARDIGERDRLEASLRESQKLESVGRLAGGVAHDLNNILTVITSNAQLGLEDATGEVRESLEEVATAAERAADLTRQLLAFARRQVVAPRTFLVDDAVAHAARMASRLMPATIEFGVMPPTAPHYVHADRSQIERVVLNLLVNARDAIADRGRIEVEVADTVLAPGDEPGVAPGRYVTIAVRDTGAGIADAIRPHIFEPFFTTKAFGEGTGLGLATSYGIARQAGGFIRVDSSLGHGSTFTVVLPAAQPADVEEPIADPTLRGGQGETVLVVDDNASVRTLQARALQRAGYRVRVAACGAEALAMLDGDLRIDALVSDTVMPRMGGVELARRLRERDPHLAVLLLSGYPGDTDFLRSLPPRSAFLQKPVPPSELVQRVHEVLAARARRPVPLGRRRP